MSHSPLAKSDAKSATATPERGRILVAISSFEQEKFEVQKALASLPGPLIEVYICDTVTEAEWAEHLYRVRPEVLVIGWAVPLLPEGYLEDPACPVRYICFFTGSVRRVVPRSYIERGGLVSNWNDAAAPAVAEHALLLMLAALRRLPEWRPFLSRPAEEQNAHPLPIDTRSLIGKTISLHGFGLIARHFIRLAAPFGVKVRAFSDGVPPDYIREHGAEPVDSLEALFADAQILLECEALTPKTVGSVNADIIELLAPTAVFVNVGRGAVIDEAALARRAARTDLVLALDVFAVEPLPEDSPLRALPTAILSPHIAGGTRDQLPDLGTRAAENLRRYLAGEKILHPLTVEVYDRST